MGRIDEAMNRANLDAGRGTGAEAPQPAASPWQVDQPERASEPDRAFASEAEVEARGRRPPVGRVATPVLGGGGDSEALERLVASDTAEPLLVEQFRLLAAALLRVQAERQLKSLIVTSPSPGDGKSHVSVNLALTLAHSYKRQVLLIDADLRRPTLHRMLGVHNAKGLSDALTQGSEGRAPVLQISDTLTLLPAGRTEADPLGRLSSGRMRQLVAEAVSRFDWVIVDTPPVGVLADAHLVSEAVDATLLVVRAGVTQYPDLEASASKLGHERILGLVLNAVDTSELRGKNYYNYYYGSKQGKGRH